MNILIVEDKEENIAAAKRVLVGHNLTIVTGFDAALSALKRNHYEVLPVEAPEKFDVVLTDCMYSKGGTACMSAVGEEVVRRQGDMPYGPLVVFHAIEAGVKHIGLITQGSHHDDPFVFGLENLIGFKGQNVNVVITSRCDLCIYKDTFAPVNYHELGDKKFWELRKGDKLDWVKDWETLLNRALGHVSLKDWQGHECGQVPV
ncbi:MAG: hypothetical protein V4438_00520 [Patescibacteria group bacterium]